MLWVAGWFTLREIIKHTSVFHPVCLKKYNKVLIEVWKYKNTNENMKEIKVHKISNTFHTGLSVVPKTNGEIYFSISIGEYIITFTCFLHCAKKRSCCSKYQKWGCHLKNRYRKNIYAKVVENARINFLVSPYRTPWFSRKENIKFFEAALVVVLCNDVVGIIMNMWDYLYCNTANTIPDIYLFFVKRSLNGLKQDVKYVQTYQVYYNDWLSSW